MTNEEKLRYIGDALRELSLFIFESEIEEKKARESRLKNFTVLTPNFGSDTPPTRNNAVSQLNREEREEQFGKKIFTEKELKSMPKLKDLSYRYKPGKNLHEFRYRRNGYQKSFSSTDFKEAKRKASQFIRELNSMERTFSCKNPSYFVSFANNYLENVKQRNVAYETYLKDLNRFNVHILPAFKGKRLNEIKAPFIQQVLNALIDKGQQRTAEGVFYLLRQIFNYAVDNDVIDKSPMRAVKIPIHRRTTRIALDLDDERDFIEKIKGTKEELQYLILLYTGVRPCELYSLKIEKEGFFTFQNKKQKHGEIVYKDIPITPKLAPYVERIKKTLPLHKIWRLSKTFSQILPGYSLYCLRHTFATRCQTCGVPQEVVSVWMGHKGQGMTGSVYTHFPPKFMLEQAKKVDY